MIKKVLKTINTHGLIENGDRILLALSGGSDSVCLLYILHALQKQLGFELLACHLNHSIRAEADDDMFFVQGICEKLGVKCFVKKVDIRALAKTEKISEELAGRNQRYAFFEEISKSENCNKIATAHNKNDVAETVLMHLIRGAATDGLCGIAYKRGKLIRPLLDVKKEDIEAFCKENGYNFAVDKTNAEAIYTRNKIRLELLPLICNDFNPAFIDVLVKNAEIIGDDVEFLEDEAKKAYVKIASEGKIEVEKLQKLHPALARRVIIKSIKECLKTEQNVQSVYVESILELVKKGRSGSSVNICGNMRCCIESGFMFFKKNNEALVEYCYKIEPGKTVHIKECNINITLADWQGLGEKFYFSNIDNIYVRNRRRGDKFSPQGMRGTKKLSDYFTDCKIPLSERNIVPIITCNGEIAWVVGKRRDSRFLKGKKAYTFIID